MKDRDRAQFIFQTNENMVLATADKSGKPWISPVAYAFDDENSFYWVSSKDSLHSTNIRARSEVAVVIYMTEPIRDAIYIDAIAKELVKDEEIIDAIKVRNTRPQPSSWRVKTVADVTGQAPWRIYKAVPKAMYLREQSEIDKWPVTVRRKLP